MKSAEPFAWLLSLLLIAVLAWRLGFHAGVMQERQRAVAAGAAEWVEGGK